MKVQELMTRPARSCHRNATLSDAARIMWDNDCGSIPVVDDEERVVGIITDRDICMALAMHHVGPDDMTVGSVARRKPITCDPEEEMDHALTAMKTNRVHRLAVVDKEGHLAGMFSVTDAVLAPQKAPKGKKFDLEPNILVDVLRGIRGRELREKKQQA